MFARARATKRATRRVGHVAGTFLSLTSRQAPGALGIPATILQAVLRVMLAKSAVLTVLENWPRCSDQAKRSDVPSRTREKS
ncbi:hypothetical protein BD310DRAFT_913352 [Dichomitus squalens]|uniref:Uncharacterized protein n=1 Tax=Dichomitus squalens TaxID=114155 RepID=A0A4V2K9Q2_9APHY|nr:hypothetical protein BD310DRAFT_913352 [Dichomitus squalens]